MSYTDQEGAAPKRENESDDDVFADDWRAGAKPERCQWADDTAAEIWIGLARLISKIGKHVDTWDSA
jgi:hypothetical protein